MPAKTLFDTPAPRVFTIPPSEPFPRALAAALHAAFPEPEALSRVTVLTPTRRAGRALGDAFAALQAGGATLLPMIRPIGDVDADDPPFEPGELAAAAPAAVSSARRRFELASLVYRREQAAGRALSVGGALALGDALAELLDDIANEDAAADLSRLDEDARAALPAHLQEAALFLDIVMQAWPARLEELRAVDPAARRSALLRALAARWREAPPEDPVIAAGSTGSIPAAAELLTTVARLDNGGVVLPGFEPAIDRRAWEAIDDSHPLRAMKSLLQGLDLGPDDVRLWPGVTPARAGTARSRVILEALRPAEATADWLSRIGSLEKDWDGRLFEAAFEGLGVVEAPDSASEARACALALRETLETPGRTAVLVTPDRGLARRVSVEMARFGVALDDSAGAPLSDTAPGAFLIRVMDAAFDPGSALALSALVASPLFSLGHERGTLRAAFGAMEREALRGRRPGADYEAFRTRIDNARAADHQKSAWRDVIDAVEAALAPLCELKDRQPAAVWAQALCRAAEALAAEPARHGADHLWAGEAGEAAADLMREFLHEAEALPDMDAESFRRALLETARSRLVRAAYGVHPRLQILGPLEARLIEADRVILAGLNEGVWPARAKIDPFLSRGMRLKAGLSAPERRFGLAAHDFAQLANARDVLLTRSEKADGAPTVASRWLWRLKTLARGALSGRADAALAPPTDYLDLARRLDHAERTAVIEPPSPRPPVEARPRRLSVTEISTWVRDPYAIYAKRVLGLSKLDRLDQPPGGAERGTAYHEALHFWIEDCPKTESLPADALDRLVRYGREALLKAGFQPASLGAELPRFERAARFMVETEATRRSSEDRWTRVAVEASGELTLHGPAGPFTLSARFDRVDEAADGGLGVIDYKTGQTPSAKEVKAGFSPQLPLTAIMISKGAFEDAPASEVKQLDYINVTGGRTPGEVRPIAHAKSDPSADELAKQAEATLLDWIALFDDETQGYPSQPRRQFRNDYGDYDHLARRAEWASADPDAPDTGAAS